MFGSEHAKARKEMEKLLDSVQMNLENNYKDLAITSRKKAVDRLAEMKEQGELKNKDYEKLQARLDEYTQRMEGYSHRLNVKF